MSLDETVLEIEKRSIIYVLIYFICLILIFLLILIFNKFEKFYLDIKLNRKIEVIRTER